MAQSGKPGGPGWAGLLLVLCVWVDALTGWHFRRLGPKSTSTSALEFLADFTCFVAAPIEFVVGLASSPGPLLFLPLFLFAAIYRLARFQVQGRAGTGYLGLPVTYNGYLFPSAGLAASLAPQLGDFVLASLLVALSFLMSSGRFHTPEF